MDALLASWLGDAGHAPPLSCAPGGYPSTFSASFAASTCTQTGNGAEEDLTGVGDYTYTQFSPAGGMVVLTRSDGSIGYLQLTFEMSAMPVPFWPTAMAGSWHETDFDAYGAPQGVATGYFEMPRN
jgi:hypothetical protein